MKENNALNGQPGSLDGKSLSDMKNMNPYWVDYSDPQIQRFMAKLLGIERVKLILKRNEEVMGLTGGWIQIIPGEDFSRTTPSPNDQNKKEGVQ